MLHAHFAAFCRFFPTKTGRGALFFTGHTRQTTQQSRENLRGIEGGGIQISPAYKSRNPRSTPKKTARAHLLTTFTGGARAASGGEPGSESAIIHLRREKGSRRHESGLVSASSLESDEISCEDSNGSMRPPGAQRWISARNTERRSGGSSNFMMDSTSTKSGYEPFKMKTH